MALNTSAVVDARGMFLLYSYMGICQADIVLQPEKVLTMSCRPNCFIKANPVNSRASDR